MNSLIFVAIWLSLCAVGYGASQIYEAQATGCPVDTIIPFLTDAKSSLDKGDVETAKQQLEEGINQLQDTFEVDEK